MPRHEFIRRLCLTALALLLCGLPLVSAAAEAAAEPGDITGQCSFLSSSKRISLDALWDDSDKTKLSLGPDDWFALQWPDRLKAQGLYLVWESLTQEYIVEQRNAAGATLSTAVFTGGMTQEYLPLDPACSMLLLLARGKSVLADLCLCAADTALPARVHNWLPPVEKADLMLVAATPGDEFSIFPGVLESYAIDRALPCALVYLDGMDNAALNAALDALWAAGLRNRPVIGSHGKRPADLIEKLSGEATEEDYDTAFVIEQLRRYRPLVLVSHAEGGEEGDARRAATYRAVRQASALADREDIFPASVEAYGLWRPSKLYLHDFPGAQAVVGGTAYGLLSSSVGEDAALDDLFENIPETAYAGYVPPEATPTPQASPTPYAPPTATPTPTEAPDSVKLARVSAKAWLALAALLLVILVLVVILAVRVIREWRRHGVPGLGKRKKKPEEEENTDERQS